jgi:hypothetical protein
MACPVVPQVTFNDDAAIGPSKDAGALYMTSGSAANITDCAFDCDTATGRGGALHAQEDAALTVIGSVRVLRSACGAFAGNAPGCTTHTSGVPTRPAPRPCLAACHLPLPLDACALRMACVRNAVCLCRQQGHGGRWMHVFRIRHRGLCRRRRHVCCCLRVHSSHAQMAWLWSQ